MRKRRTVLWLYTEDYEYLSAIAKADSDSKNTSMQRLVKALRKTGVRSFLDLSQVIQPRVSAPSGVIPKASRPPGREPSES
jgi:hypothetical protein